MEKLISCAFNIDTACVELHFTDGSIYSINCTAVENEAADNRFRRSELDYLIYNDPCICRLNCAAKPARLSIASVGIEQWYRAN